MTKKQAYQIRALINSGMGAIEAFKQVLGEAEYKRQRKEDRRVVDAFLKDA